MFTGIVEEMGIVGSIISKDMGLKGEGKRLTLEKAHVLTKLAVGESVAINGCCLTIVEITEFQGYVFDIVPQTLAVTNLNKLKSGDKVNLEGALVIDGRLNGHIVQGHVDGVGKIVKKTKNDDHSFLVNIEAPSEILHYIVKKGSITVEGVSLTVVDVDDRLFSFAMIPHTAQVTTLGSLKLGDLVNLEVDIIAKYVEKLMKWEK